MVSTFTPNKSIEQPARGDDVGTWDTPVNNNMSLIDNCFGGVATVALVNTPVVLSSGQYQCVFLTFTGAISANIPITLPAVGSFYTVQNLTSNTSAFYITMLTTASTGQAIGIPPGEACDIFTDGTNVKFRNLARIGSYWDHGGSSVPSWVSACTVPPYLNCDGSAFSSATYPILATILGGTTLPDSKGRFRATLNQGSARITSGSSTGGIDGNTLFAAGGSQTTTLSSQHIPASALNDPGHVHGIGDANITGAGGAGDVRAGAGTVALSCTATTGITIGTTSLANFPNLPPAYIGGITMIRAA